MAGFIHEFRARMVESYINSFLAARGGDAAIIMRKELVGSVVKGEENCLFFRRNIDKL